jgi:ABC-type transport system involved in cytochrome bd biosynthesis fused ATPase/permease subunit
MSEVFLGVIAVATGLMALVQIAVLIAALIAVKKATEVAARVEAAARPLIDHVDDLVVDTTESIAAGRAQIDRVEQQAMDVLARTDRAVHRVQDYLIAPARQGIALAAGARALFGALGAPLSRAFRSTH